MASTASYTAPYYHALYGVVHAIAASFGTPAPLYHAVPWPAPALALALNALVATSTPAQQAWVAGTGGHGAPVPPGTARLAPVVAWLGTWLGE